MPCLQVPILATHRMRQAYGYIDDDRVTITRPQAISEIQALNILRSGSTGHSYSRAPVPDTFLRELEVMIRNGWRRSEAGFKQFKRELWDANREAIWRILNDRPGVI